MKKALALLLGCYLAPLTFTYAEESPKAAAKVAVKKDPIDKKTKAPENERIWVTTDYVGLWTSKAPQPNFPLLTLGNDNVGSANSGALGDPATSIFYQPRAVQYGVNHGFKLAAGGWITEDKKWGAEASLLWTPEQNEHKTIRAPLNISGLTTYRPYFDFNPASTTFQQQAAFILGGLNPQQFVNRFGNGAYPGGLTVKNERQFWGTDLHGMYNVVRNKNWSATALLGFKYLSLDEHYQIDYFGFTPLATPGTSLSTDKFHTENQFYGADLGMKFEVKINRFFAELTPKVAVGTSKQDLHVTGSNTNDLAGSIIQNLNTPNIFLTTPGGFWAQPSNMGSQQRNVFTVLPSLDAKVGVRINKHLDFNVGYTFMYWSHVAQPGNQLDSRLNGDQSYLLNVNDTGYPTYRGNNFPARRFKDSDFWAQGVTAGFKVKF